MPLAVLLPLILQAAPSVINLVEGLFKGKAKSGTDKMTLALNMIQGILTQLQESHVIPPGTLPGNDILQPIIEQVLKQLKLDGKLNPTQVEKELTDLFNKLPQVVKGNTTMSTVQANFDNAYWASLDPKVKSLNGISDFDTRTQAALMLAQQGFTIDIPIQVWDWDPYLVMLQRTNYGYPWVPSALQPPISVAPGILQPGTVSYDPTKPPPGSIKVSLNIADYPPFNPPAPAPLPVPSTTSLVGIDTGAGFYAAVLPQAAQQLKDGDVYALDPRGVFTFHAAHGPFGSSYYFVLQVPVK